jgi:transglutaminase-like putative cysteine protease
VAFIYRAEIPSIAPDAHRIQVWVPLPLRDAHQSVSHLSIRSNLKWRIVDLPRFGNRAAYFYAAAPIPAAVTVTIAFDTVRREQAADMALAARAIPEPTGGAFAPFLAPDRMIPLGGRIAKVAAGLDYHGSSTLQQARTIYQYVTASMTYVHRGKGVGHGDALFACDLHHGNCTDFHSLFIALARARGIPARFTIGMPLGTRRSGEIPGYHCWAEFYAGGVWVPIDAAKAWQMPARHNYYFGHVDAGRIAFTRGRDLELVPRQHGKPLNYFIYPYAEVDGMALPQSSIKLTLSYRDLPRPHPSWSQASR